ncbi:MAG: hypothetical protein K2X77_31700, partial [Candidatus Obscuribacterales bacterium]|nr:hypothetical protein [Candidatus Obscuribacterales bacterium]
MNTLNLDQLFDSSTSDETLYELLQELVVDSELLSRIEAGKMPALPGSNRSLNIRAPYESEIALEKLEAG